MRGSLSLRYLKSPIRIPLSKRMRMMFRGWLNPFYSFRAQMVIFVAALLLLTIAALYKINQRGEERLTHQVNDHIEALTRAVDTSLRSLDSRKRLYDSVREEKLLKVSSDSIIHHI